MVSETIIQEPLEMYFLDSLLCYKQFFLKLKKCYDIFEGALIT